MSSLENLIICSADDVLSVLNIRCKSVEKFLTNIALKKSEKRIVKKKKP